MDLSKQVSVVSRFFFVSALGLAALAVLKGIVQLARLLDLLPGKGFSILGTYAPGRLLEFAAIFLIFVIAILLRQIREALLNKS